MTQIRGPRAALRMALLAGPLSAWSEDGPPSSGWRNDGSGRFGAVAGVPPDWGPAKNIRWKALLRHRSNAAPVLVAGRLYVCVEPDELLCVAAYTGQILWRQATTYLDLLTGQQLDPATRALLEQTCASQMKRFEPDGLDLGHNPNFMFGGVKE